ncbi:MAG: hypothetical protein K8T91_17720 [Planctomycetes bacterium]|nr:hypothetical protein [Planctomycetota bacterium]
MDASPAQDVSPTASSLPPAPRRFQFTLGTMLAVTTVASTILGLLTLGEWGLPGLFYTLLIVLLFRATRQLPTIIARPGFWRRQFDGRMTGRQWIFDILFGILLPVFCLWADFFLFKTPAYDPVTNVPTTVFGPAPHVSRPWLWTYSNFAYAMTAVQITLLLIWLLARQRTGPAAPFLGGALISGSVVAMLLGLFLFPFATVGLMLMLTGVLGYTPLLTAFVYYRQGTAALRFSQVRFGRLATIALALAGSLTVAIPFIYFWQGPAVWK